MNFHRNMSQRTGHHLIVSSLLLIILYSTNYWSCLKSEIDERYRSNFSIILLRTCRLKMVLGPCLRTWSWSLSLHGSYSYIYEKNSIKNMMSKMNYDSSVCVVIMDFKIKFETMKHRENAVENFRSRGLSWHDALDFYSVQVYFETDVYEMRQETMYINHISGFNNKKDATYVIYIIESRLKCIKRIFPDITGVILQSDNAISNQNAIMSFFLHMLRI